MLEVGHVEVWTKNILYQFIEAKLVLARLGMPKWV